MTTMTSSQAPLEAGPELFLLDGDPGLSSHVARLRQSFRVTTGTSVGNAAEYLRRAPSQCQFLVSDVSVDGQETFELFRAVKALPTTPTILVTTADVERVPDALLSGGDAVLLKPFPPNLLCSRLGRLKRERASTGHGGSDIAIAKARHISNLGGVITGQTAVEWPFEHCPHCNASPVTSFDFVSHRRAWYACLACKKVWIAADPTIARPGSSRSGA